MVGRDSSCLVNAAGPMSRSHTTSTCRVVPILATYLPAAWVALVGPSLMCFSVCMSRRINVVLSDETHRELLRQVTRGDRSRVLEEALREYLRRRERLATLERLAVLRKKAPAVSMRTIVAQLRRDRGRA